MIVEHKGMNRAQRRLAYKKQGRTIAATNKPYVKESDDESTTDDRPN